MQMVLRQDSANKKQNLFGLRIAKRIVGRIIFLHEMRKMLKNMSWEYVRKVH